MARISPEQLKKLQKRYHTDEAIGKLFGISRQAVFRIRKRYGIAPVTQGKDHRDTEIVKAYTRGQTATRIARRFHLSAMQVYRILRRHDVPLHRARNGDDS